METYDLSTWEEFEDKIVELKREVASFSAQLQIGPLFRGQRNSEWSLVTTLERELPKRSSATSYYDLIFDLKSSIEETFGHQFSIDSKEQFAQKVMQLCKDRHSMFQAEIYMAYLRQFGFPSPLLDWTKSSDQAAYFAFSDSSAPEAPKVSIYSLVKTSGIGNTFIEDWRIIHIPHEFDAHERHRRQNSEYTICIEVNGNTFTYASHEAHIEDRSLGRYIRKKYTLPISEKEKVLEILDKRCVNEFTTYGTEDSLLKTLAMREMFYPAG